MSSQERMPEETPAASATSSTIGASTNKHPPPSTSHAEVGMESVSCSESSSSLRIR